MTRTPGLERYSAVYAPHQYPGPKNLKAWLAASFLSLCGWKVAGKIPEDSKWVAIGCPHTSNWDFPFMIAASWVMGVQLRWMGKASLFKGPLGKIMLSLGGVPVDRTKSNDMVQQMVDWYAKTEALVVAIPPSGTRGFRDHWKTGFYFIAQKANVPIGLGILDFVKKEAGFPGQLNPSGDIDRDFISLKEFYDPISGKIPANKNTIRIRPKKAD
jgi:1-acyl-sn-glycerol-3-phosphate acyltransferase